MLVLRGASGEGKVCESAPADRRLGVVQRASGWYSAPPTAPQITPLRAAPSPPPLRLVIDGAQCLFQSRTPSPPLRAAPSFPPCHLCLVVDGAQRLLQHRAALSQDRFLGAVWASLKHPVLLQLHNLSEGREGGIMLSEGAPRVGARTPNTSAAPTPIYLRVCKSFLLGPYQTFHYNTDSTSLTAGSF